MKKIISFISLCLSVFMILGLCGCKKTPTDSSDSASIIYQYNDIYVSGDSNSEGSDANTTTSNGNSEGTTTNGSSSNTNTSGNTSNSERPKNWKERARDLNGRTITVIAYWDATAPGSEHYKSIKEIEKALNCKFVEKKMSDYKSLYSSILAGKPMCDMFATKGDMSVLQMANKGMLTPISDCPSIDTSMARWSQTGIKSATLNGKVYGVGISQLRDVLVYNVDMFKQNGWPDLYELQKSGKLTWDKLFEIMKLAAAKENTYGLVPTYDLGDFGQTLLHSNGVGVVTRTGDSKTLNYTLESNAGRTAINTLANWAQTKNALYNSNVAGWDSGREVFYSGKAAMALLDDDMFSQVLSNADFEVGMVNFPKGPNATSDYVSFNFVSYVIPANVKNPDDVLLFYDIQMDIRVGTRDEKALIGGSSAFTNGEAVTKSIKEKFYNGFGIDDFGYSLVRDELTKVALGETSAASAIASFSQKADAYIKDYWK